MQDGLCRFDGRHFIYYRHSAPAQRKLLGVDIRDLAFDSSTHTIWALSGEGGLNAIDCITGKVIHAVPIQGKNDEDWNISMTLLNGKLWIGAFSGIRIYNINQERFEPTPPLSIPGITNGVYEIRSIHADSYDNVWAGITGYGMLILNGKDNHPLQYIPLRDSGQSAIKILSAVHPEPGVALLGTNKGLKQIKYDRHYKSDVDYNPCKTADILNHTEITALNINHTRGLIVATDHQLYKLSASLSDNTVLEEPEKKFSGNWLSTVLCLYADSRDNLWMGCTAGIAFLPGQTSPFLPVCKSNSSNDKLDHVYSIYPLNKEKILAGLNNGFVEIDVTGNTFHKIDDRACYYIFKDPNNRILTVNKQGIFVYENNKLIPVDNIYKEFHPYADYTLISYLQLTDSTAVLGTDNFRGILLWNFHRKTVVPVNISSPHLKLAADVVNTVYKDKQGRLWVLADKAITIIDKQFQRSTAVTFKDPVSKQHYNIFFDICEAKGDYWIAAYGMGIIQIDHQYRVKHIFNSQQGLCNDGVYKLFNYRDSILVITTNNGLSVFDVNSHIFSNYFEKDGLHANTFEEACGIYRDGRIYAGGVDGFTIIDPAKFQVNNNPPQLYLDAIKIETASGTMDTTNIHLASIQIPNHVLQSTIYFSALNYSNPDRVRYIYKIDQLHDDWINIGNQPFLTLTGLSPGNYTLHVKASNEDGIWSPKPITLTLVYQPHWYQTLWFKMLLLVMITGFLYGLYRSRINQLRRQQQIRRDIAGDLHDDLGSTLNTIKVFAHLVHKSPKEEKYHMQIAELLAQATTSLRDMIWVLDESVDTVYELAERIKKFVLPVIHANGICFECTISEELHSLLLSKTEKRNLLLIAKESINNSIKYADCKHISVTFGMVNKKAALFINDDGNGFDMTKQSDGNGLRNIQYRAKQIQYQAQITSSPNNGTSIKICKYL